MSNEKKRVEMKRFLPPWKMERERKKSAVCLKS
jgi:hypothetical protein